MFSTTTVEKMRLRRPSGDGSDGPSGDIGGSAEPPSAPFVTVSR
jgi:hypothetical protein